MDTSTLKIAEAVESLNLCYVWTEVDAAALPAALQADADLDAGRITVPEWERAWMRAGKVVRP